MHTSGAADLQARRAAMAGDNQADAAKERTEKTVHLLNDQEKMEAVEKRVERVTIGTPPQEIVIMPLTPGLMVKAWPLISKLFKPLIRITAATTGGSINIGSFVDALGDDISFLPDLLHIILSRGNEAVITKDWIDDHVDLIPDAVVIMPIFIRQNRLDKLFLGKQTPPPVQSSNGGDVKLNGEAEQTSTTEASQVQPVS